MQMELIKCLLQTELVKVLARLDQQDKSNTALNTKIIKLQETVKHLPTGSGDVEKYAVSNYRLMTVY